MTSKITSHQLPKFQLFRPKLNIRRTRNIASIAFFDVFLRLHEKCPYSELFSPNAGKYGHFLHSVRYRHILWHRLKAGLARKIIRKTLPFVSSHIKGNVEVIHFHIKSRGVQGLVLVQTTLEKCTTNFNFEINEIGIKTAISNFQPLLAWNVFTCLRVCVCGYVHPP